MFGIKEYMIRSSKDLSLAVITLLEKIKIKHKLHGGDIILLPFYT